MAATNSNFPRPNFAENPLLWLAISFAIGVFVAGTFYIDWKLSLSLCILSAIIALIFIEKSFSNFLVLLAFLFSGVFYFGLGDQNKPINSLKNLYDTKELVSGDPIEIEGVLEGKPEIAVGGMFFVLKAEKAIYKSAEKSVQGRVRIFAPIQDDKIDAEYRNLDLNYGTRLRIACNLNREEKYLNPGSVSFKKILDQQDLDAVATVKSPLLIERLNSAQQSDLFESVFSYRQNLIESFRDNFSIETSGILIASLLGNRHFLTKDTAEIFRDGGTFHVLVISGLHITFIGGIILLIVRRFTRNRFWQFFVTAFILWLYAIAVGAEIPVIRAALMFSILLFSFVIYRKRNLLNALGGCAFLILVWEPNDLFNQSFHLTFASLAGIIGVVFPLVEKLRSIGSWQPSRENPFPPKVSKPLRSFCETLYWSELTWSKSLSENLWDCKLFKTEFAARLESKGLQKPLRWIFEGVLVTAVVQIFLLPFLVLYFHRISFSSILLNLWVGIFVVLQNITAITSIIAAQVSQNLALPLIKLTEVFNWILLALPRLFISLDIASARIPVYSGSFRVIYILYFIPVVIVAGIINLWDPFGLMKRSGFLKAIVSKPALQISTVLFSILLCLIAFNPYSSPKEDKRLTLEFLDVGQGDAIFVKFPNGKTMLIDGGGRHSFQNNLTQGKNGEPEEFRPDIQGVGDSVVSEFLWEKGYSRIDFVLATHSDADHIQGLATVVKNFSVGVILVGRIDDENEDFTVLRSVAERKSLQLTSVRRGNTLRIGESLLEVLNPAISTEIKNTSNDDSLVIRLTYGSKSFLLTGDIEKRSENQLSETPETLKADVVKVAHHGSRTSSTQKFIDATNAQYAVIPVGRKSRFGHPHPEVVERWKRSGAKVLTTGEKGTVSISTDGKDIRVNTYLE